VGEVGQRWPMGRMVEKEQRRVAVEEGLLPQESAGAAEVLHAFLSTLSWGARQLLLCHSDADGLSAAVVLRAALERAGWRHISIVPTGKGQSAWTAGTLTQVATIRPEGLFVLDLGSRPQPIFPGVPTILLDHHRPLGVPPGATLISSYEWPQAPCTSALVYYLSRTLADMTDLAWVAALGIISDLGEDAQLAPLPGAQAHYGAHVLREATALVNAARRSATGDALPALDALLAADEPAAISHGHLPEAVALAGMRRAFQEALQQSRRAAPTFHDHVALIRVHSPYLVHPALAQMWRRRLPHHIVLVANDGYLPGQVNFSVRTALDINLLDFLQPFRSGLDATEFGYGHDKATGGSLRTDDWQRFLATLGFRK